MPYKQYYGNGAHGRGQYRPGSFAKKWYGKPGNRRPMKFKKPLKKNGKRPYRKKVPLKKKVARIAKQMHQIRAGTLGVAIRRSRTTDQLFTSVSGNATNQGINVNSLALLASDALDDLKYFDPAVPDTLQVVDPATAITFSAKFYIKRCHVTLRITNNFNVPCYMRVYGCMPKADTSRTPAQTWADGMVDIGGASTNDPMVHPTDSPQFNLLWKIVKMKKITLQPGHVIKLFHNIGPFMYDRSVITEHNQFYQKKLKGFVWQLSLIGGLTHNETGTAVGRGFGGVDFENTTVWETEYDAGIAHKDVLTKNDSGTIVSATSVYCVPNGAINVPYNRGHTVWPAS